MGHDNRGSINYLSLKTPGATEYRGHWEEVGGPLKMCELAARGLLAEPAK